MARNKRKEKVFSFVRRRFRSVVVIRKCFNSFLIVVETENKLLVICLTSPDQMVSYSSLYHASAVGECISWGFNDYNTSKLSTSNRS